MQAQEVVGLLIESLSFPRINDFGASGQRSQQFSVHPSQMLRSYLPHGLLSLTGELAAGTVTER